MKKSGVLLIIIVMVLSTVAVIANTIEDRSSEFISVHTGYVPHLQQTNMFDPDWIHFDDGTNVNALGLTDGGMFEFAARFTPDELADWAGYQISVVRHHHGWPSGSPFQMSGNIKIYGEGTSTEPGDLITSEPFEVTDNDWFDVELSEPVQIIFGDEDIWVSIEVTHNPGQYPAGFDDSPVVDGKGDWLCLDGEWQEMQDLSYDFNWNIWAKVEVGSIPPETPERPEGPTEGIIGGEYTFSTSTTDPDGDQIYYLWDWDDGTYSEWLGPYDSGEVAEASHIWSEVDTYEVRVKAKDIYNRESNWSDFKTICIVDTAILEIGNITGGLFKISAVIKNSGSADARSVEWSISLDGGFILLGKETSGRIVSIPAGEEVTVSSDIILGVGKTVVTVTAEKLGVSSDTKKQEAFVLLFFIMF